MADYFRCAARMAIAALAFCAVNGLAQESGLIAGQNINMVSGKTWPAGDPFLQRQNEPSLAVSTRNEFHLTGGSNDYRTVDLPGLPEGKTIGDSWISTYFSIDGGGRWTSTLLPGYPQDITTQGNNSPLFMRGFEASADPVIRAGTNGLFYYSGIAFNRGDEPASAGFVATFMDLNNDERKNTTGYVRTAIFDEDTGGAGTSYFVDKPWIAVDKPRNGANSATLKVHLDLDETDIEGVSQTVECGNLYVAYARIEGDGTIAVESQIMFSRSVDCGASFSLPIQVSADNTINQGASVAIEPTSGHIQVAWRQFENATLDCVRDENFWRSDSDAWPVDEIEVAGITYSGGDAAALFPRKKSKGGMPWLVLRQLLSARLNALSGADIRDVSATMAAAEAWLIDNPPGSKPKKGVKAEGNALRKILRDFNQGKFGLVSCDDLPAGGLSGLNPNAILVARSTDGGQTFTSPVAVTGSDYHPFEQGTTGFSFRTTGYPTMTFDGDGRSYIAYATRGMAVSDSDPVGGDSRIVVTTSMDGTAWTAAQPIDEPLVPGHQIMPAFDFGRGQVFLLYYDFRRDLSGVFDRFIVDLSIDPTTPRHSTDVRAAVADAADVPEFTNYSVLDTLPSTQTSRYPFLVLNDEFDLPFSQQTQFNLPNLPMFKDGTAPFFGDYVDIATLHFVTDELGNWQFDTDAARGASVAHAIWTDNRDVIAPLDGDWSGFVPVGGAGQQSKFDPTQTVPVCTPSFHDDRTQMRNQNVYTSRLTQGLAAAIPGNNRPLGIIQRAFVGFVQNMTDEDRSFRLTILNQPPPGSGTAGRASFEQFSLDTEIDVVIKRSSSISQSVFVTSSLASASIDIRVEEYESGIPVPNGLTALMRINPDSTAPQPTANNILTEEIYTPAIFNPALINPAIFNQTLLGGAAVGIYSPAIFNPAIFNNTEGDAFLQAAMQSLSLLNPAIFNPAIFNPAIFNPAIFNPAIFNPAIFNPAIFNPAIFNPAIFNPAIFNPAIFNPAIFNPAIFNPAIFNPAIFNPAIFNSSLVETTVMVENTGNATTAYSLNLDLQDVPAGFLFQLMIYRTYLVLSADGCTLTEQLVQEQLVNETFPDVNGNLLNTDSTSFYVAPGDNVIVTLRIVPDPAAPGDPSTIDTLLELGLSQSVVPQAVDSAGVAMLETQPTPVVVLAPSLPPLVIDPVALPTGEVGTAYPVTTLTTSGGDGSPVVWSEAPGAVLPPGLSVSMAGQIVGTPTTDGVFNFDVRAIDDDQIAQRSLSITVTATALGTGTISSADDPTFGAGSLTLDRATGLGWLDLIFTLGRSFNDVNSKFGAGAEFEGFRYASAAELITLYTNIGFVGIDSFTFDTANLVPATTLLSLMGTTCPTCGPGPASGARVSDVHPLGGHRVGHFTVNTAGTAGHANVFVSGRSEDADSSAVTASHLVREFPATIVSVILDNPVMIIEATVASLSTANVANHTAGNLLPVMLTSRIDQGAASRPSGSRVVTCGAGNGVLTPGPCSFPFSFTAKNSLAGPGTLIAGPATITFSLVGEFGVVFNTLTLPITLVDP